jgi:hypothetical protein
MSRFPNDPERERSPQRRDDVDDRYDEHPRRRQSRDSSWLGRVGKGLAVFAVLALIAVAFLGGRWAGGSASAPRPTTAPTAPPLLSPTPVIVTDAGVLRRIESTQILQTTVFRIDTLVRAKKEGSWFFNWGGQNLLLFVKGKVTAGVDLSELKAGNISVSQERKTIEIRLPQAKMLSAVLDGYEIEDYEGNKPDSVDPNLVKQGLEAGRQQIATTACEDGILERATEEAKSTFERIVRFPEFANYRMEIFISPAVCVIEVAVTSAREAL